MMTSMEVKNVMTVLSIILPKYTNVKISTVKYTNMKMKKAVEI